MAMPGIRPVAGQPLTRREREVLAGFLAGRSEKQIAAGAGLSIHTVGNHRKALHAKLDVSSRGELLALFVAKSAFEIDWIAAGRLASLDRSKA